ncbi:MAG: OmpA family protein [Gammaproteobacteria bacterium]|nr:OmpA family protein [Gammaproteobacteria bacterium]
MNKFLLTLLTLLWSVTSMASTERVYMSPMEASSWTLTSDSILRCELEHSIPGFGKAVFYRESGRVLGLKFISDYRYKKDMEVAFRSISASWKGVQTVADLAKLKSTGSHSMVSINSNAASYAYFELRQGYQPSLYFINDEFGTQAVSVILSTVNFSAVDTPFSDCVARLYPDHFDDVKLARVQFDFDDEFPLPAEEERALGRLLSYLKVDNSIQSILVSGHADYKGTRCYNDTLSARRAWYVYDYLMQSGVDSRKLRIEFKGESSPLVQGKDDKSRAKNRRVEVRLQK